jgi:hypothetical protein
VRTLASSAGYQTMSKSIQRQRSAKLWQQANLSKHRVYNARFRKANPTHNVLYQAKHKTEIKTQKDKFRATPAGRMQVLLSSIRVRALKAGLKFESRLFGIFIPTPPSNCFCCGRLLDYSIGRGKNNREESPSFDRLDNTKGYTKENTFLLCVRCNENKSDMSFAEIELIYRYMRGALHVSV